MFSSVTATGALVAAGAWMGQIYPVILIVIGFGLTLTLANWVVAKFRKRGGGRRKKK